MIERVIENWLTSANERTYQVPFCQALELRGYRILHISGHGVSENGKDIIAVDDNGVPCAFQLVTGDIAASKWRDYFGEITELIELPIEHPSVDATVRHRAILVTNGQVTDDVRTKITALNRANANRNHPELELLAKRQLLRLFIDAQGEFLPREPEDMHEFLSFYTSDGKDNIELAKFSGFLERVIGVDEQGTGNRELSRRISSALLLVAYALKPFVQERNYISIVQGWVVLLAHIYLLVAKKGLQRKYWDSSIKLCKHEILSNLEQFKYDVMALNNKFLQGDIIGDGGVVYKIRTTIVLGWLASVELINAENSEGYQYDRSVIELIRSNYPERMLLYGECAVPYFMMAGLLFSHAGDDDACTNMYCDVLKSIVDNNNTRYGRIGLASPYYTVDKILGALLGMPDSEIDFSSFVGTSYTMKTLVECLARRDRRSILERIWYRISYTYFCEFKPKRSYDLFKWENSEGTECSGRFDMPQSWKSLKELSRARFREIPEIVADDKDFLILFLLTYPHRLVSDLFKIIDDQDNPTGC